MKPGWKTSEAWASFVAVVTGAFAASGLFPDDSAAVRIAGLISSTLAALGYAAARTSLKKGGSP